MCYWPLKLTADGWLDEHTGDNFIERKFIYQIMADNVAMKCHMFIESIQFEAVKRERENEKNWVVDGKAMIGAPIWLFYTHHDWIN